MADLNTVERMPFGQRRSLRALIETDGRQPRRVSQTLAGEGIVISASVLQRYWKQVHERLLRGDVILSRVVHGVVEELEKEAREKYDCATLKN